MRMIMTGMAVVFAATWGGAWAQDAPNPAIMQARTAIQDVLNDPESARFKNERVMPNGAVCGEVNAKNSRGGYVGFQPFAVDASLGLARVREPGSGAYELVARVLTICDRNPGETLRTAQIRWTEQALAEYEREGMEPCQRLPSSRRTPPESGSAEQCAKLTRDAVRWRREDLMALVEKE